MSTVKLDLKRFKHVKSDANSTTLQHPDGHTITMAHKSLSPEAQQQLSQLATAAQTPMNTDELKHKGMMAEGGIIDSVQIPKSNPKLEQSKQIPPKPSQAYRPPKSKQNDQQSRVDQGYGKVMRMAEGGEAEHECEGIKFCMHCGGAMGSRKMYPDGGEVMQDDPDRAEAVPTGAPTPGSGAEAVPVSADDYEDNGTWNRLKHDVPGAIGKVLNYATGADKAKEVYGGYADKAGKAAKWLGLLQDNPYEPQKEGQPTPSMPVSGMGNEMSKAPEQPLDNVVPDKQPQAAPLSPEQMLAQKTGNAVPSAAAGVSGPASQQAPPQQEDFKSYVDRLAGEHMQVGQETMEDLMNGHIQPKTYADLFANRSTMGKIGSILGVFLGGIGSGLTKQPNAALQMMDNIIKNDFAAQQNSKDNAQNLLRLSEQHELNQANIQQQYKQGLLTDAQANLMTQEAKTKAMANAQIRANQLILHHAFQIANTIPKGDPRYQNAQEQLAYLANAAQGENYSIAEKAAGQRALMHMGYGEAGSGQGGDKDQYMRNLQFMDPKRYELMAPKYVPGVGFAARDMSPADKSSIAEFNTIDNQISQALAMGKQYGGIINSASQWVAHPEQRVQVLNQAAALQKSIVNAARVAQAEGAPTAGRLSQLAAQLGSNPASMLSDINSKPQLTMTQRLFREDHANHMAGFGGDMSSYAKNIMAKAHAGDQPQQQFKEGQTGKSNGVPVVFRNGQWQRQ